MMDILHRPETISLSDAGKVSLWYPSADTGYLGNFYSQSSEIAQELLSLAQDRFIKNGVETIYGPINGNTWNQYRFVTSGFTNKPFVFEPFNPESYPRYFIESGFEIAASYESSILKTQAQFAQSEISLPKDVELRQFDLANSQNELNGMYTVATQAFAGNFLYSDISKEEFVNKYKPLLAGLDPRLIWIAKRQNQTVGFIFAMPYDFSKTCRTVVIKTICRLEEPDLKGLGLALASKCHQSALALGYTRCVHALYKSDNASASFSEHHQAKVLRKYALFQKKIK